MSLKDEIQAINNRYAAVLSQPGAPGAASFFAKDADLLPPGPDNMKGPETIGAFWAAATEHFKDARLTTVDVAPLGRDAAREIGTYWALPGPRVANRSAASTCSFGARSATTGRSGPTSGPRTAVRPDEVSWAPCWNRVAGSSPGEVAG
jgi:SnoaL-like domain